MVQNCLKAMVCAGLYFPVHIKDPGDLIEIVGRNSRSLVLLSGFFSMDVGSVCQTSLCVYMAGH